MKVTRLTKLKMLLTSFEDAKAGLEGRAEEHVRSGSPSSRSLERRGEAGTIWRQGSYAELEAALDEMPLKYANALFIAYIWHPSIREHRRRQAFRAEHAPRIETALEILDGMMGSVDIPKDIFDNYLDYGEDRAVRR